MCREGFAVQVDIMMTDLLLLNKILINDLHRDDDELDHKVQRSSDLGILYEYSFVIVVAVA